MTLEQYLIITGIYWVLYSLQWTYMVNHDFHLPRFHISTYREGYREFCMEAFQEFIDQHQEFDVEMIKKVIIFVSWCMCAFFAFFWPLLILKEVFKAIFIKN